MTCASILQKSVPNAKVGFSKAMSSGWLRVDKTAEGGPRVFRKVSSIEDSVRQALRALQAGQELGETQLKELKKRKLISNA